MCPEKGPQNKRKGLSFNRHCSGDHDLSIPYLQLQGYGGQVRRQVMQQVMQLLNLRNISNDRGGVPFPSSGMISYLGSRSVT